MRYIFIAGIFAGLAFFTKVQYVFYIVSLAFLVLFIDTRKKDSAFNHFQMASLFVYMIIIVLIAKYGLLKLGVSEIDSIKFSNKFAVMFWIIMVTQLIVNSYIKKYSTLQNSIHSVARNQLFFFYGFCASLLVAVVTNGPIFGAKLAAQAYKMTIARDLSGYVNESVDYLFGWMYLQPWHGLIYFLLALPVFGFILITANSKQKPIRWTHLGAILGFLFLAMVNLILILRPTYRDLFPAKSLLLITSLTYSAFIIRVLIDTHKVKLSIIYLVILAILVPFQYYKSKDTVALINAENTHYGYNVNFFVTGVYGGNHTIYQDAIKSRMDINGYKARKFKEERNIYNTILPNVNKSCTQLILNPFSNLDTSPEADLLIKKSVKYKFSRITSACMGKPLIHSKWSFWKQSVVVYDFFSLNNDVLDAVEILPRGDLNLILISYKPLNLEYSKYYSKTDSKTVSTIDIEWDHFTQQSNTVFQGIQRDSGKAIYVYHINRYTRAYLKDNEEFYLGYSETF